MRAFHRWMPAILLLGTALLWRQDAAAQALQRLPPTRPSPTRSSPMYVAALSSRRQGDGDLPAPAARPGGTIELLPAPPRDAFRGPEPGIILPSPEGMVTDGFDFLPPPRGSSESRISDEVLGIRPVWGRPPLIVERNGDFLGPGFLSPGINLPTGAVWRPSLWVYGTNRSAAQYFEDHVSTNTAEVVDRLDLFTQLNLTGTERWVLALRPFDHEVNSVRRYSSYDFTDGKFVDGVNLYPQSLFFEGDFGEMFPNLDAFDTESIDYGFSVGRQAAFFQEGLFINADILDAVTVTRNTLYGNGVLNSRATFMYAPSWVHRNTGLPYYTLQNNAQLFALLTQTDLAFSTVEGNLAYVYSPDRTTGDGIYFGVSSTQRLQPFERTFNSAFHVLGSFPVGQPATTATGNGVLLFNEISLTPRGTENLLYLTTFCAIGDYVSPARGVQNGGPLSPAAGILFARPQIGVFGSPISSQTNDVLGGALGYQFMWDGIRKQMTFEFGGRQATAGTQTSAVGFGTLYQQALGQHRVLLLNGAVAKSQNISALAVGARVEILTKF